MLHNLRYSLFLATLFVLATIFSFSQEQENKIRFGGRVANATNLFLEGENLSLGGYGFGFAIGPVASIPILNIITFNPEINLIYREFNMLHGDAFMSEIAISFPALFQYMPFGGPLFYVETGIQLDISLSRNIDNSGYGSYSYRDAFLGIPFGIGWHIGRHFVIDYRMVIDLFAYGESRYGDYGYEPEYEKLGLIQEELSLLYLF